jgi:prephenate dehydrogenase
MKRIAVVGLGQIGGSIVLSLQSNRHRYSITGIDPSSKRVRLLRSSLDFASRRWSDAGAADLIILCTHYKQIAEFLSKMDRGPLVMDVCSGKAKLVQIANRRKLRFIGGHPMAGNEFAGEKGWRKDLFNGSSFFLCPAKHSSAADVRIARSIVKHLGARPVQADPVKHDLFVAITSHFPAVLSGLLREMGRKVPEDFKGPGYQSMTRLADTSSDLMKTFLQANLENVQHSAKQMRDLLEQWIRMNAHKAVR